MNDYSFVVPPKEYFTGRLMLTGAGFSFAFKIRFTAVSAIREIGWTIVEQGRASVL